MSAGWLTEDLHNEVGDIGQLKSPTFSPSQRAICLQSENELRKPRDEKALNCRAHTPTIWRSYRTHPSVVEPLANIAISV